jgi:hypothetical protein
MGIQLSNFAPSSGESIVFFGILAIATEVSCRERHNMRKKPTLVPDGIPIPIGFFRSLIWVKFVSILLPKRKKLERNLKNFLILDPYWVWVTKNHFMKSRDTEVGRQNTVLSLAQIKVFSYHSRKSFGAISSFSNLFLSPT